jgi:hypothetical protein
VQAEELKQVGREAILAKRRGAKVAGEPGKRTTIRGTFFCCCASAMTVTGSNITAIRINGTAVFFIPHFLSRIRKLRKVLFTPEGKPDLSRGKRLIST